MIQKLEVQNFKRFEAASFEFDKHVVIVGPNNCGKTTLLQAIAVWSEICRRWLSDQSRIATKTREGEYVAVEISRLESLPYKDFRQMWRNQDTLRPITLSLQTERWTVGFEMRYVDQETLQARPSSSVVDRHLTKCAHDPLNPVYIPPFSGLTMPEPKVARETVLVNLVQDMLHGRGGSVLRNMLLAISADANSWYSVQSEVQQLFGYELTHPSGVAEITVGYRQATNNFALDIACGARGFLQVLFIYACLHYADSPVIMVDEPDSHLYLSMQEVVYNRLKEYARSRNRQLIVVTHSELLMEAADKALKSLTSDALTKIKDPKASRDALRLVRVREVLLAQDGFGILYVEGDTDLRILRAWAQVLDHRALGFLEGPLRRDTAGERDRYAFARRHFGALRLSVPDVRGILLEDRNGASKTDVARRQQRSRMDGLKPTMWTRYDIESYLVHPEALLRFVGEQERTGVGAVDRYMKKYYGFLYDDAFDNHHSLINTKGEDILGQILDCAQIYLDKADYYRIAEMMTAEDIHPDVKRVLDAVANSLAV